MSINYELPVQKLTFVYLSPTVIFHSGQGAVWNFDSSHTPWTTVLGSRRLLILLLVRLWHFQQPP